MPRGLVFGSNWDYFAQANEIAPPGPIEVSTPPEDTGSVTDSVRRFEHVLPSGKPIPRPKQKAEDEPTYKLREALGLV